MGDRANLRTWLVMSVLLLGLVGNASATLVGRWTFDDGTADDSSGGNHHGTLTPGDVTTSISIVYDIDRDSNVLELDNPAGHSTGAVVNCGSGSWADITSQIAFTMWAKVDTKHTSSYLLSKGSSYQVLQRGEDYDGLRVYMFGTVPNAFETSTPIIDSAWHHIAVTYDSIGEKRVLYIDGAPVFSDNPVNALTAHTENLVIGGRINPSFDHRGFDGWIDDVQLYDNALSASKIRGLVGMYMALDPSPENKEVVEETLASLTWKPGAKVADVNGHKLYLGTNRALVEANDVSVYKGALDSNSFSGAPMGSLELGTDYYWRVIEVNGPNTWPGDIWSFITETEDYSEGYYCDLFIDAGASLSDRDHLVAADYLGLSQEFITGDNWWDQNSIMVQMDDGEWQDDNGVLLYPDGEPRFRCIYVGGGGATSHGASLGETGRQRIRDFYYNGGGYTGSCSGAFLCSTGTASEPVKEEYLHIWPGRTINANLTVAYTGMDVPPDSALLDYYDFGGDNYVASVAHNLGCYVIEGNPNYWALGTEVLATYALPVETDDTIWDEDMLGNASCWAYKDDAESGRLCPCGGHPEIIESGEQRDLQAALLQYAMAGNGSPNVKAALENGVTRLMNDNSTAGHEKVGDKQYHHFTIQIPSGMKLTITLDGLDDVNDLDLFARKDYFALRGEMGVYEASNTSNSDETLTINDPCAGTWYIGVKGAKTVTKTKEPYYYRYTGNLGLLNGVAYTITAEWYMLGDFAGDYGVDSVDFSVLALSWQKGQGQTGYDPNCDISIPADDIIDEKDFKIFTDYWLAGK